MLSRASASLRDKIRDRLSPSFDPAPPEIALLCVFCQIQNRIVAPGKGVHTSLIKRTPRSTEWLKM